MADVIIDERALDEASATVRVYLSGLDGVLNDAIRKIQASAGDWNDEDYENLLSAISSFMADMESIKAVGEEILSRLNAKIEAIHRLRNITI